MLYKTITGDTLVSNQECFLMGVELAHSSNTDLITYAEPGSGTTAANKISTLSVTAYKRHSQIMFPWPGIKVPGIYTNWTAGVGTIYYRFKGE